MSVRSDKTAFIEKEIAVVEGLMQANIVDILDTKEKVEVLVNSSEKLKETTKEYFKETRKINKTMCLQHWKLKFITLMLVLTLIYIVIGITCGWGFECFSK